MTRFLLAAILFLATPNPVAADVPAKITLDPTSAAPGQTVTVKGTGFGWRWWCYVTDGGVQVAKVQCSSSGNFTTSFVAKAPVGPHTIKAKTAWRQAEAVLTVTGDAPPPPPPPPPPDPEPPQPTGKYPPDTKLQSRAIPSIPALPAIRVPTRIGDLIYTRITEAGKRHAYAKTNPLSRNGKYLFIATGNLILDGQTYQPIRTLQNAPGYGNWSRTADNLLLGTYDSNTALLQTDVLTDQRTVVHDFGRKVALGAGEGSLSDAGIAALMDSSGNICTYDTVSGAATPWFKSGGTLDSVTMSHDGQWVIGGFKTGGSGSGRGTWTWRRDGSQGRQITTATEHADAAVIGTRQVWVAAPVGGVTMVAIDLETLAKTTILDAGSTYGGGHVSGRGEAGRVLLSTYLAASASLPGSDGLFELRLDGSKTGRWYGFAYHRATDYGRQPHAVALGDGRILFASDWGTGTVYDFIVEAAP